MLKRNYFLIVFSIVMFLSIATPSFAIPQVPGIDIGIFSVGAGGYNSPDAKEDDTGFYVFAKYEIAKFQFEVDYSFGGDGYLMGSVDYLFYFPTAEGITQTAVAFGIGASVVGDDPSSDDSVFGGNALIKVRFIDTLEAQLKYDFLEGGSSLITLGLGYIFF